MPDPLIEKKREPIVYGETEQEKSGPDYDMREIRPGHFVYCTPAEAVEYEKRMLQMERDYASAEA